MSVEILHQLEALDPRFAAKIELSPDGCMLWTGARGGPTRAYGHISRGPRTARKYIKSHRYAYELIVGPIPDGLQIDHLCRVTRCVNPEHLEAVTPRENVLRSGSIPAINAIKTHCPQGHPYDEENTYIDPKHGRRRCRICNTANSKASQARLRRLGLAKPRNRKGPYRDARLCEECGSAYEAHRPWRRFCTPLCAHRRRRKALREGAS